MRYYISDCHFYHAKLNEHMDHRGFASLEAMHTYMISQWNRRVQAEDEVVILGDLSLGKEADTQEILRQLHGRLYLILGNHDKWARKDSADLSRFEWVKDYAEMYDNGRKVICCHYPICCYSGQFLRDKANRPRTYMLHGHIHNTQDTVGLEYYKDFVRNYPRITHAGNTPRPAPINIINCFCMFSDYVPLTLDEWIALEEQKLQLHPSAVANDIFT